jgi:hypothetical protein
MLSPRCAELQIFPPLHSCVKDEKPTSGIEVSVIDYQGRRSIACTLYDLNQMVLLTPQAAKEMAFLLVKCADFVEPPFDEGPSEDSLAIFGPYEDDLDDEEDEDDEDDDDEDDDDDLS